MKKRTIFIIGMSICILAGISAAAGFAASGMLISDKSADAADESPLAEKYLEEHYKTDFIYDGSEVRDIPDFDIRQQKVSGKNMTVYHFHPENDSELNVSIYTGNVAIHEVVPYSEYRWYEDDLADVITERVKEEYQLQSITVSEDNITETAEHIYDLQSGIIAAAQIYSLSWENTGRSLTIDCVYNSESHKCRFDKHDMDSIETTLWEIIV